MKLLIFNFIFLFMVSAQASLLAPLKLDHPRDTMKSFISAMNDYKKGIKQDDPQLEARIEDAIRCMDLSEIPKESRVQDAKKAAIFLKEVIDRVIVIDYSKIPDETDVKKWRLKDTEITIRQVQDGDRVGDYLISSNTVDRAQEFYKKVQHLPYLDGSGMGAMYKDPFWKKHFPDWMTEDLLGMAKWQWIAIFILLLIGFVLKKLTELILELVKHIFKSGSQKQKILVSVEGPSGLLVASAFWYLGVQFIDISGWPHATLMAAIKATFTLSMVWAAYRLIDIVIEKLELLTKKTDTTLDDQLVPMIAKSLKVFVAVFGVLLVIQNMGFNVMSLLAGLGLGGLAFALAAKDTAANFFGSIMIILDRPFKVGDWIVADNNVDGTVVEVGFRSTRIRTFYNSLMTVPNSLLATINIDNMGERQYRRVKTTIGVTYDTPPEKMEAFLEGIKNIILANPYTNKENFHIVFNDFGPSSLNILFYCFVETPTWSEELIQRQNLLLEVVRLAKDLDIEFAFPTQTLHLASTPEKPMPEQSYSLEQIKTVAKDFSSEGSRAKPQGLGIYHR